MSENELMDRSAEKVAFLRSVGLDPTASVAVQLADVRLLIGRLREYEVELERWARSGDFNLSIEGEPVSAVVGPDGTVMIVHSSAK